MESTDKPFILKELKPLDSYYVSEKFKPYLGGIVYSKGDLESRIEKLAWEIANYYKEEPYTMLVIMKGAINFSTILNRHLSNIYSSEIYKNFIKNEYAKVKRVYDENNNKSISISGLEFCNFENKNILLIEDVIDSGLSLKALIEKLDVYKPKSIKICGLIAKKPSFDFKIDFLGILSTTLECCFVGFGLDYREYFRDFPHLASLNERGKEEFKDHVA